MILSRSGSALARSPLLLVALLAAPAPLPAQVPESVDPEKIPNYRVLRPDLAVGGQPSEEAVTQLGEMGFKTIINLRTRQEGALEEEQVVRALGLDYVWVPVRSSTLSLRDVEAVEQVLSDPERAPVLLHCGSSDRVGAVWGAIQARAGRTLEEAEAAAREAGLKSPKNWEAALRVLGAAPETALEGP